MKTPTEDILRPMDDKLDLLFIGNRALYRLCDDHPRHAVVRAHIGKVLVIGRAYAVALDSQYLHFHRPALFFIYDSGAAAAIGKVGKRASRSQRLPAGVDEVYGKFVLRLLQWRQQLEDDFDHRLSPRQLDRILLSIAA